MSLSQLEKGQRLRALHAGPEPLVIPNPWDAGSARLLQALGFSALASSSYAAAGTLGRKDYGLQCADVLGMAKSIVEAVDLPVSADLENGFGDRPEDAAETIRRAAEIGLVGGSIEDAAGGAAPYDLGLATERIAAAAEAVKRLPFPFVLVARAENYARGKTDLDDTIKRLQAYERAGAEVLFAPGLPDLAAISTVCAAITKPLNVVGTMQNGALSVAELKAAGVRRISLAASFYRAAMTGLNDAAREVRERGTFTFVQKGMAPAELGRVMR